ncbi:hypothetical protein F4802DRAFT_374347 [Xylaria palmicola]|nr:hypothetical protein F4802DRAFT_374347 [Xylaria palmicola]
MAKVYSQAASRAGSGKWFDSFPAIAWPPAASNSPCMEAVLFLSWSIIGQITKSICLRNATQQEKNQPRPPLLSNPGLFGRSPFRCPGFLIYALCAYASRPCPVASRFPSRHPRSALTPTPIPLVNRHSSRQDHRRVRSSPRNAVAGAWPMTPLLKRYVVTLLMVCLFRDAHPGLPIGTVRSQQHPSGTYRCALQQIPGTCAHRDGRCRLCRGIPDPASGASVPMYTKDMSSLRKVEFQISYIASNVC